MNAVLVRGDAVGPTLYYGRGAGEEPTASAVVDDLVDVTRPHHRPTLATACRTWPSSPMRCPTCRSLSIEEVSTSYYLRMRVDDQPGVLADIARILADRSISIGSMIQQPARIGGADIIFLTHEAVRRQCEPGHRAHRSAAVRAFGR